MNIDDHKISIAGSLMAVFLLLAALAAPAALALDPKRAINEYGHDVWRTEDGLPQNSVQAIVQTHDGYLWFGTQAGLVRFDGLRFTVFDRGNTAEIQNNDVRALFEDREESLWIGTSGGGLTQYRRGRFIHFTLKDDSSIKRVMTISGDRQGGLWIGGDGLARLKDGALTRYSTKDGLSDQRICSIHEARDGTLWVGTAGGFDRLKDGKFVHVDPLDGSLRSTVNSIVEDGEGSLWIGTEGRGLYRFRDGEFARFTTRDGLSSNKVYSVMVDHEGTLWAGTSGAGLIRLKDGQFNSFASKVGASNDIIASIYEDREGSLWIGTSDGLSRLKDNKFTSFTTRQGLSPDDVSSVYQDREGNLWIGTSGGGLNLFRDGKFTQFDKSHGLSGNTVYSLFEDREGSLWIGTDGGGLDQLKDGEFTRLASNNELSTSKVLAIYEDRDTSLWIGTAESGLCRLKDGEYAHYTTKEGLSSNRVLSLAGDREGSLWVGSDGGGLSRFKNGQFTQIALKEGLASNSVYSIHEDREGNLWLGTDAGLGRLKNGKFFSYRQKDGLFADVVFQVLEDGQENLWMSCPRGIFRVSKKELTDFADGKLTSIISVSYGKADGMESIECKGGFQPAGWKTSDGKLWFTTTKGVATIDPANMKLNGVPPLVAIERVVIDKKSFAPTEKANLPAAGVELEFHYAGLSFVSPKRVRFKYKLEGFDKDWVDAGTRREAFYTNIPSGSYSFKVLACNDDGMWSQGAASFDINLNQRFYKTRSFFVGLEIALMLLVIGAFLLHIKRSKGQGKARDLSVSEREHPPEERAGVENASAAEAARSETHRLRQMVEHAKTTIEEQAEELRRSRGAGPELEMARNEAERQRRAAAEAGVTIAEQAKRLENLNELLELKVRERFDTIVRNKRLTRYFPKSVIERLFFSEEEVELVSERRNVTIFFSNLTGFTDLTDKTEPERITKILNEYLTEMVIIIQTFGGTPNKFMADGILAFLGAPDEMELKEQARNAVLMAICMQRRMEELSRKWLDEGLDHNLRVRIGIHQDYVTVGNLGSKDYMDYTIVGRAVDLAKHLESSCTPGRIQVSFPIYALTKEEFPYYELEEREFRGFGRPLRVCELDPNRHKSGGARMVSGA